VTIPSQTLLVCECIRKRNPITNIHLIQDDVICCDHCYQDLKKLSDPVAMIGEKTPLRLYGCDEMDCHDIFEYYIGCFNNGGQQIASHLHLSIARGNRDGTVNFVQLV